ncbi:hypothetical protein Tco_0061022, partial [Tanacetum coccineum]
MNIKNQNAALNNLETQIEQLTKDFQAGAAKEEPSTSIPIGHCKMIFSYNDALSIRSCSTHTSELLGASFISNCDVQ